MAGQPVVFSEAGARAIEETVGIVRGDTRSHDRWQRGVGFMPSRSQHVQIWEETGGHSVGDVLEANAENLFPGRLKFWKDDGTPETREDCWVKFADWYESDSGDCYALHGKYYSGRFVGNIASGGTSKPLYIATLGNFECWCKADSAIAKGASGTVSLYNDDFTDSTINRASTLAKFMDVDTTQWCILTRTMGTYIVQPVECPA